MLIAFETQGLKTVCVVYPHNEITDHMTTTTEIKYSTYWYGSNLGDRRAILNLIGRFATENPLEFHLRKDGRIGLIRVNIIQHQGMIPDNWIDYTGQRKVLKEHMWILSLIHI